MKKILSIIYLRLVIYCRPIKTGELGGINRSFCNDKNPKSNMGSNFVVVFVKFFSRFSKRIRRIPNSGNTPNCNTKEW